MIDAQTTTADNTTSHRCGGHAKKKWSAAEIGTMVGGFIVFWPLGLVALGSKLIKGEMWPGASENVAPWTAWQKPDGTGFSKAWETPWDKSWNRSADRHGFTGNAAFDDYRKSELAKLDEMRRKLDEDRKDFAAYVTKLRKAKDQDEFDRFMAERTNMTPKSE